MECMPDFARGVAARLRRVVTWTAGVLLLSTSFAHAIELRVDIGVADMPGSPGKTPNHVEPGFVGFNVNPNASTSLPGDLATRSSQQVETRIFSGVSVSIAATPFHQAYFYDQAPDVAGSWGDLAEDGVSAEQSDLIVTLAGLPAGTYDAMMFHHWANLIEFQRPFDIFVDAGQGELLVAGNIHTSLGFNLDYPDGSPPTTSAFQFVTDGSDVRIRLIGEDPQLPEFFPVYLNGFTIVSVAVPEPSTWILLGLGMFLVVGLRARCRKRS